MFVVYRLVPKRQDGNGEYWVEKMFGLESKEIVDDIVDQLRKNDNGFIRYKVQEE